MSHSWLSRLPWAEMFRFGVMGALSTALYLSIMLPLKWLITAQLWLVAVLAYLLSMAVNYVLQRRITFRSHRRHQEAVTRFVVVQLIGLGLNALVLDQLVTQRHYPFWFGQGVAVVLTSIWSYGAQKVWVFMHWGKPSVPPVKS
jgi:putative flippase GtrA